MSKNFTQSWFALDVQKSDRTAKKLHRARVKFSLACGSLMTGLATTFVLDVKEQAEAAANISFGMSLALGATATGMYLVKTFSLDREHSAQEKAINAHVDQTLRALEMQMDGTPPESTTGDSE